MAPRQCSHQASAITNPLPRRQCSRRTPNRSGVTEPLGKARLAARVTRATARLRLAIEPRTYGCRPLKCSLVEATGFGNRFGLPDLLRPLTASTMIRCANRPRASESGTLAIRPRRFILVLRKQSRVPLTLIAASLPPQEAKPCADVRFAAYFGFVALRWLRLRRSAGPIRRAHEPSEPGIRRQDQPAVPALASGCHLNQRDRRETSGAVALCVCVSSYSR